MTMIVKSFWTTAEESHPNDIVVEVVSVSDQQATQAALWLCEHMDHDEWNVFHGGQTYPNGDYERISHFHFREHVDLSIVMLFKLTWGGK